MKNKKSKRAQYRDHDERNERRKGSHVLSEYSKSHLGELSIKLYFLYRKQIFWLHHQEMPLSIQESETTLIIQTHHYHRSELPKRTTLTLPISTRSFVPCEWVNDPFEELNCYYATEWLVMGKSGLLFGNFVSPRDLCRHMSLSSQSFCKDDQH